MSSFYSPASTLGQSTAGADTPDWNQPQLMEMAARGHAGLATRPPAAPTQGYAVEGFMPAPETAEGAEAQLSQVANDIIAAGMEGNKDKYLGLIMSTIHRLRSRELPETPPELEQMGMVLDRDGRPVPLQQFVSKYAHDAEATASKIGAAIAKFQADDMPKLQAVEQQAFRDYEDANMEARYGMPADNVRALKAVIAAAAQHPEDDRVQSRAQDALARLSVAEENVVNPERRSVWSDKSKFESAMFIALNAMAGAMKAYGYQGPTPLEVADRIIDEDLQRQMQVAKNRDIKAGRAQTAWEIASRRTTNAVQAELLAKDMMWAPIEAEAKAAGLFEAVAEIKDKRLKNQMDYRTTAFMQQRQQDAAVLGPLVQMYLQQERQAAGASSWRNKQKLLTDAVVTVNAARSLTKLARLWGESQTAAIGFLLGKVPGNITDANVYEKVRRAMSIEIAAAQNGGRPTKADADAVYNSLPSAGSIESGGKELIALAIDRALERAKTHMAAFETAAGTEGMTLLLSNLEKANPALERYIMSPLNDAPLAPGAEPSGFVEE